MSKKLFVIVHENFLRNNFGKDVDADKVLREIERIKREEEYLEVKGDPDKLPHNMPRWNPELYVFVVGASKWICCAHQLLALRMAHYSQAKFHPEGCYDNGKRSELIKNINGAQYHLPEFFR